MITVLLITGLFAIGIIFGLLLSTFIYNMIRNSTEPYSTILNYDKY